MSEAWVPLATGERVIPMTELAEIAERCALNVLRGIDWADAFGELLGHMLSEADTDTVLKMLDSPHLKVVFEMKPS